MEQTQRQKLELPLNRPTTLQLLFDNPLTGESRHGPYWLFALVDPTTREEYSFFAPSQEIHEQLSHFNAGDNVTLLKTAKQSGKKVVTEYSVTPANGGPLKSFLHDAPPVNGNGKTKPATQAQSQAGRDKLYELMLQSYMDALAIQQEVNSLNVDKCAISLYISRQRILANGNGVALTSLT
ncbi:MAG: hypothetical protein IH600_04270 [Bacteroidetes bacterium]|nr:hypothetical protein [Bacteroidota bacterium]